MTREEAIEQLQNCKGLIKQDGKDWLDERDIPLLDMAIEALHREEAEEKGYCHRIKPKADRPSNVLQEKNPTPIEDYMTGKSRLADRPIIEHDREWIIGCIQHDGFIHTHRFDKANRIIFEALQTDVVRCKDCRYKQYDATHNFCEINHHKCYDDDFCSWGERGEE